MQSDDDDRQTNFEKEWHAAQARLGDLVEDDDPDEDADDQEAERDG